MSKVITYTLEADGTVPDFVLDGGYFPSASGEASPQDWLLVGVASDSAPGEGFADAAAIESHLLSIGAQEWTDPWGNAFDLSTRAATMWARLSAI